jgi:hypothetical protein
MHLPSYITGGGSRLVDFYQTNKIASQKTIFFVKFFEHLSLFTGLWLIQFKVIVISYTVKHFSVFWSVLSSGVSGMVQGGILT